MEEFAAPISLGVIGELIGIPAEHRDRAGVERRAGMSASGQTEEDIAAKAEQLRVTVVQAVEQRHAEPAYDLITTLIRWPRRTGRCSTGRSSTCAWPCSWRATRVR